MALSALQIACRAFVSLLLALARSYDIAITVNRDSTAQDLEAAFRKLMRKVHPDKGGCNEDAQRLQQAREDWRTALGKTPSAASEAFALPIAAESTGSTFRVHATAIMLTFQNFTEELWTEFLAWIPEQLKGWTANHWCATLEACKSKKLHVHLMLQFRSKIDRTLSGFIFKDLRPNVSPGGRDLCGEGLGGRRFQQSVDRGFFYVWADKVGTVRNTADEPCVAGNYQPAWTGIKYTYQVFGKWLDTLWRKHMLTYDVYEKYIFLARDGVGGRKRNLDLCRNKEEGDQAAEEVEERIKRIRGDPTLFKPFPRMVEAQTWLNLFVKDALRYPILIVMGPSRVGKTEWAKSLFKCPLELKIGTLEHFPEGMREFNRKKHDGIILDDVRDLAFLGDHQDKLQGKYDSLVEFASTPGGTCSYKKDLFSIPIVATINLSTKNKEMLQTHDWLGNPGNRFIVEYKGFDN
jgi:hypothetical protein